MSWFYKWIEPRADRRGSGAAPSSTPGCGELFDGVRAHLRLAAVPRRPARGWLEGRGEHGRRLDAPAGLAGPQIKRRKGLTKQDKTAPKFPDLVKRDFTAAAPNLKWCGDITEIPTDEGKLYLATVIDLYSRRLLAAPTVGSPRRRAGVRGDQDGRGGARRPRRDRRGDLPHRPRIDLHRRRFHRSCAASSGSGSRWARVGSCFDNAAAEAFFSTLEHEVLSRHHFTTKAQAREVVMAWCHDFYNTRRRHSSAALMPPIEYEKIAADQPAAA